MVRVYGPDAFEVEFVRISGRTHALVQLALGDIRPINESDVPAARSAGPRRGAA